MPSRSQSAIITYRALRMGVVAAALLLMASLVLEIVRTRRLELTSISASFYSPVRNVFVGVLVATGLALIAIMGREKSEDGSLNLAGMLAPTIGMLPTTVGPPRRGGPHQRARSPRRGDGDGIEAADRPLLARRSTRCSRGNHGHPSLTHPRRSPAAPH